MKKSFLLALVFLNLSLVVSAQSIAIDQYEVVDIPLLVGEPLTQPFEQTVGAIFRHSSGLEKRIEAFYNGRDTYLLRFSAENTGLWEYMTYSSITSLSGKKGTVSVSKNDTAKGGIVVDTSRRRKFQYQNGDPYFPLAFEIDWLFALDQNAEMPKTKSIVQEIAEHGFNQVVMNVYAYDVAWPQSEEVPEHYEFRKPETFPFLGSNENPDFTALNISFFTHLDRVINHLNQNNIVAHLMIYVWNKKVNWPAMYSQADNRYFDYIIKRYQAYPNIIWDISKEALDYGRCDIPYINERISRIRENDAYNRLITVHDYEYCSREPSKVDFISIQNWRSDLQSQSLLAYQKHTDKPLVNIEHGGYEKGPYLSFQGNYVNPEVCLERSYHCLFAGLYTSYYWQNSSWNIVIYNPMSQKHSFEKPRFDYYKNMQSFFTKYPFSNFEPSIPKLTTNGRVGEDNLASSAYPLSNGKGTYLYFVPKENYQINVVIPEPADKKLQATWFNIFTGEYKEAGTSDWWIWKPYASPWQNTSSILILEAHE